MVAKVKLRAWVTATALCGTPSMPATLVWMLWVWGGSAEIYATIVALHRSESAALVFAGVNVLISGWLFFNLLRLAHELKRLRLPQYRHLLIAALGFILGITLVAPCALVLSLQGGLRDLIVVGMGPCVGVSGALLWYHRVGVGFRKTRPHADASQRVNYARSAQASRTLRIALGTPYAPTSWRARCLELALVCMILASLPFLVTVIGRPADSRSFSHVLQVSELVSLLVATGLCWTWPLARASTLFDPKRGAAIELALLPGMGDAKQQRRRLYQAVLSIPTAALIGLLIVAMSVAWLQDLPSSVYVRLVVQFAVFPLITLPMFFGILRGSKTWKAWSLALITSGPMWSFTQMIWTWPSDMSSILAVGLLRWMSAAVLLGVAVLIGMTVYFVRKLASRPHPFVDVSA